MKHDRANEFSLVEFGQNLVTGLAVPALAQGYARLVNSFRHNEALAKRAAEQGVEAILSSQDALAALKKNNNELVTAGEKEAEAAMRAAVRKQFPGHAIIGEELGFEPGSKTRWVFDPVDGTSAMVKTALAEAFGMPLAKPAPAFGITIAVVEGNEAIIGIVAELKPQNGILKLANIWAGEKGKATTLNGNPVTLPKAPGKLADAVLACTVPEVMFNTAEKWSGYQALREATLTCMTDQNCVGFMRLLQENGGVHVAYESDLAYHDAAALIPIFQGAGVMVSDGRGLELHFPEEAIAREFTLLAAAPGLHQKALYCIQKGVAPEKNSFSGKHDHHHGYANKFPSV